jgi:peptidoglycan/xylan/chitin deacetylase (PgdA/CDA1 family)
MHLAQGLVPYADLTEEEPGLYKEGLLRKLHAVLAFDDGYQPAGMHLLAWHIEASNTRSG